MGMSLFTLSYQMIQWQQTPGDPTTERSRSLDSDLMNKQRRQIVFF